MTEFSFASVSVASSGDEYFQISFNDGHATGHSYFLIQRQFEDSDGGYCYVESHLESLCGHFKIRKAELGRDRLRLDLEIMGQPIETVQIGFVADDTGYAVLKDTLGIMIPSGALKGDGAPQS